MVDHDGEVPAYGLEGLGRVHVRRRREDDEVDLVGQRPQLFGRRHDTHTGVLGSGSLGRHHVRNYAELARDGRIDLR